ncbi:hypothetical protein ACFYMI_25930 [Streptomyces collinus]|uniref:hypothetical protein n=1 Tax=Streptomyces collinus TaxID=42684 RepID=UPI0036C1AA69
MEMNGVDLLRIEGERVAEVWLFSASQQGEDDFWGKLRAGPPNSDRPALIHPSRARRASPPL